MDASTFKIYFECSKELQDSSTIVCPICKEASLLVDWPETEMSCWDDLCSHGATMCPKCEEMFDSVYYTEKFEIKDMLI